MRPHCLHSLGFFRIMVGGGGTKMGGSTDAIMVTVRAMKAGGEGAGVHCSSKCPIPQRPWPSPMPPFSHVYPFCFIACSPIPETAPVFPSQKLFISSRFFACLNPLRRSIWLALYHLLSIVPERASHGWTNWVPFTGAWLKSFIWSETLCHNHFEPFVDY